MAGLPQDVSNSNMARTPLARLPRALQQAPRSLPAASALALAALAGPTLAQWDPANGQWGKECPSDLRIMTWNVGDGICSSNDKSPSPAANDWEALARIVAAMKPDVLILQETGDNSGQGTGSGVDSVFNLTTTLDLFLHGGTDPFNGGSVTAFVQAYDPAFDLPHVYVSSSSDGFNRNCILSAHPFADLNGDTRSTYQDTPFVSADKYAAGGTGGIRGFAHCEIDLPDGTYAGDLVVGNSHLKAGGGCGGDHTQRVNAARNIAYYIDHIYNGAGTGVPDPNNVITDNPPVQTILDPNTPVVWGGDWNEVEGSCGKGPARWMVQAQLVGGTDGTDRDRTDAVYDSAQEPFTGDDATIGSSKLDYLAHQDSIVDVRRSFVFDSGPIPVGGMPAELQGFLLVPAFASGTASDHLPVVMDLILPSAITAYGCDVNPDDSLAVLCGRPNLGETVTFGVDNPLGTQSAGSLPLLFVATAPAPGYPCGLPFPGFGMAGIGATGEALLSLVAPDPFFSLVGAPWNGSDPAPIDVTLAGGGSLVGLPLYFQGVLVDLFAPPVYGLTEARELVVGP